ncbi:BTB/POZ domain-containing protein 1-like [Mya arenaria]|nr:BTB/POZ domain-containing protein 1-like [Mya arenaria]
MSESWQHSESFAVTNAHMLDAEVLCDVTILAGEDKQEVKCHRFILASRSPVLYTMFCGSLPETGVVEIPDVEASVFRQVVRFLYNGEIQVMPETVMALMYVAKKYDIKLLTDLCKSFLEKEIAVDNVCTIIDQAVKFDEKDLIQQCLTFVSERSDQVFKSDKIMSISPEALRLVLQQEKEAQSLQPEEVYGTCKKWAKNYLTKAGKENMTGEDLRQHLGGMILLVDFARMSYDDYTDMVVQDDILSKDEKIQFLTEIRHRRCKRTVFINRFNKVQKTNWNHGGRQDGISFKTSKNVILTSVALYRPFGPGSLTGTMEILENQKIVLFQNVTVSYKDKEQHEDISLIERISIREGVIYSVRQRLKGGYSYSGTSNKKTVTVNHVQVEFMNLKAGKSDNGTSLEQGQIHGLTFEA